MRCKQRSNAKHDGGKARKHANEKGCVNQSTADWPSLSNNSWTCQEIWLLFCTSIYGRQSQTFGLHVFPCSASLLRLQCLWGLDVCFLCLPDEPLLVLCLDLCLFLTLTFEVFANCGAIASCCVFVGHSTFAAYFNSIIMVNLNLGCGNLLISSYLKPIVNNLI